MRMRSRYFYLLILIPPAALLLAACSTSRPLDHPTAYATLWVQNSAEYDALTRQVYRTASSNLALAIEDSYWTAAREQTEPYYKLPPAIILDVDETVLDNSPFQARMIRRGSSYDPGEWTSWVREAEADAIEGAVEFTTLAAEKGVTIFYVTNREHAVERSTLENLEAQGFPLADSVDVLLTKNERENWTSDKSTRRSHVASDYRILMLFGDDLNDFVSAKGITMAEREELIEAKRAKWGREWYILPNPYYGSWVESLYNFDDSLSERERNRQIEQQLDTEKKEN